MPKTRWPREPSQFHWIVDGHNAIFAHPELAELQTGGEKARARRRLEEMLERFAAALRLQVTVVYDGNRRESNPDQRHGGRVRTLYSQPPEEEADDRIVRLCSERIREGTKVVVVSSDRATLGARLPSGVLRLTPGDLFRRLDRAAAPPAGERPPGDWSDIEAHFLALEREEDPSREHSAEREKRGGSTRRDGNEAGGAAAERS